MTLQKQSQRQQGFSLIELAMVLIVIGLIVGGILKGQDLLESARMKATLQQVNEYRLAVGVFMDRYDALPGDFSKASSMIKPGLQNGNGNGKIEGLGLAATPSHESLSFWQHLSEAQLIPHVGDLKGGHARFGQGAPDAKIGGGFTVRHAPHPTMPGHWFVLGRDNGAEGNGALLTPLQAYSLLKKADDDHPDRGRIRAKDGAGVAPGACIKSDKTFNTQNTEPACVVYFQF